MGRLGNQMFQFASTLGIADKLGYDVKFPLQNISNIQIGPYDPVTGKNMEFTFDIPKCFQISDKYLINNIAANTLYQEPNFHFNPEVFNIPDGTNLHGYFQSEKYFEHCINLIKEQFTFKPDIINKAKSILKTWNNVETVSIHVRVGDYKHQQHFHPVQSQEYYAKALNYFVDKDYQFICFTDDKEYCKHLFQGDNIYFSEEDQFIDLCLMSLCDHNIIANSSFSWWGAWLNNNIDKKVIVPKNWFGSSYTQNNTKDLYCKNWILI